MFLSLEQSNPGIMDRGLRFLHLLCAAAFSFARVYASDPELVTDFAILPKNASASASDGALCNVYPSEPTTNFGVAASVNASTLDGHFFTFTGLRNSSTSGGKFSITKAFAKEFPALTGLGISYAFLIYPPGTINVPHMHPRGSEILYVVEGTLSVGLVDTTNKLFTSTLYAGDVFVFPKGLVHFQANYDQKQEARAIAALSSSNPGTVSLPTTLFGSAISEDVVEKSFDISASVFQQFVA